MAVRSVIKQKVYFGCALGMLFELTSALTDEILFFMEDQDGDFLLDTREGIVINTELEILDDDGESDEDRYVSLPEWGPSDGFRLMERFTAGLRNTPVREELSAALNRGRGVFRAFKDTLARHPETEKLWFGFKDREMKSEVISWYNTLRESRGLELIGEEPEDISGLVLEDFRFREGTAADRPAAEELHRTCLSENDSGSGGAAMPQWVFPGEMSFVAETSAGEFAGYVCAAGGDGFLRICAVEVRQEYRGLGLGKTLLTRFLENAVGRNFPNILIDLPAGMEHFSRVLLREDFRPVIQRYCRTTL